jgi:hypothetical protein
MWFSARASSRRLPGQRLLAHELTHAIQQQDAQPTSQLRVEPASSGAEHEAQSAAARGDGGGQVSHHGGGQASVQRSSYSIADLALDAALTPVLGPGPQKDLIVAAMGGFADEMKTQLVDGPKGEDALNRLKELKSPGNIASLVGGYVSGAALGVISPLTGLFDLAVFAESMSALVGKLAGNVLKGGNALVAQATEIVGAIRQFASVAAGYVKGLSFEAIFKFIVQLPAKAVEQAGQVGHSVARKMIHALEEKFEKKQDESWTDILTKRKEGESYSKPLGLASAIWERGKEKVLNTPWAKIGHDIGYAIGAIVVNILLLATTGGIGNAIAELGAALGRVAPALTRVAEAVKAIGSGIAAVEHAIGVVFSKVLKPLEPLMEKLGPLLEKLRAFLRRLLGLAEEEASAAVAAGAKALAPGEVGPKAPKPAVNAPPPEPKAAPAKPKAAPRPAGAADHVPPAGAGHTPPEHAGPGQAAEPTPPTSTEGAAAKSEPLAKEPVAGGHAVEVTERGVEICSPKPCPVLDVEYAKELAADLKLRQELDSINKLRKASPKDAAKRAAKLREELELRRRHVGDQEPLVAVKVEGANKGQYWEEGTRTFAKRGAGDPEFVVLPKSEAELRKFRPAGSEHDFTIEPRRAPDGTLRESEGAGVRPKNPHPVAGRVGDEKTGQILDEQVRADARTQAIGKTVRADINEAAGYNHLIDSGEYGLLRPGNVSTPGVDAITVKFNGETAEIYLNDFTSPTLPKASKAAHKDWREELQGAIGGDRLRLGDKKLEDAIRQAAEPGSGRVFTRTVRVDLDRAGRGGPLGTSAQRGLQAPVQGPLDSGVTLEPPVVVP